MVKSRYSGLWTSEWFEILDSEYEFWLFLMLRV